MPLTRLSILQEIGFNEYAPFYNPNCPIWVEGSYTSKDYSILETDISMLDAIGLIITDIFQHERRVVEVDGSFGLLYRVSEYEVEYLTTTSMNTLLAPWQEARLPSHPGDTDANATKAILVWLAYWANYAVNLGATPFFKIGEFSL